MMYRVTTYIRVEPDPEEEEQYTTRSEAQEVLEHLSLMQPENIYEIEEIEPEQEGELTNGK